MLSRIRPLALAAAALLGLPPLGAAAQELDPRALVNAPVGVNFLVVATGYLYGSLLLDPSVPIQNGHGHVGTLGLGYVRSIGLFGLAGKVGLVVPAATGTWKGDIATGDTSTSRTGFGDPMLKLSLNFIGSPALHMSEYRTYRQSTVAGLGIVVTAPLGQYYPDRLINLGSNRWSFTPRLGISQVLGRFALEGYADVQFYTANNDFFGGHTRTQKPFFDVQGHVVYNFRPRGDFWAAASVGYGWGGRTTIDGAEKDPLENVRTSAVLRVPLAPGHGLKFVYINGLLTGSGTDFDTFQLAYQYTWGGKP
jgi:hypothetical protein